MQIVGAGASLSWMLNKLCRPMGKSDATSAERSSAEHFFKKD